MPEDFELIDLVGYEGFFPCPNCGANIDISRGHIGEGEFKCNHIKGCEKEFEVFAKEVE